MWAWFFFPIVNYCKHNGKLITVKQGHRYAGALFRIVYFHESTSLDFCALHLYWLSHTFHSRIYEIKNSANVSCGIASAWFNHN